MAYIWFARLGIDRFTRKLYATVEGYENFGENVCLANNFKIVYGFGSLI